MGFDDEVLSKLKFLISSHILANSTAKLSSIVLPGAGYAEKRGSMINATGRLQLLNKAIESPGNSRDDWEILQDLNCAMDGKDIYYMPNISIYHNDLISFYITVSIK